MLKLNTQRKNYYDFIFHFQANYSLTKSEGRKYCKVFLTVNIEHIASDHEFYAIPVSKGKKN